MKKIIKQSISFFGISGIGWILDFILYITPTNIFKINIDISNMLSSLLGVTFVFITSTRKLFINNSKIDIKIKYLIYIIYQIILIIIVSKVMFILKNNLININLMLIVKNINIIVKIIITPFTMLINFIVMKNLIEKI